jgi:hypothetical protein
LGIARSRIRYLPQPRSDEAPLRTSIIRLAPQCGRYGYRIVWSWDCVMDRTDDGRPIKMLTLIYEFTKEALAFYPAQRIRANAVIDIFADVMIERGVPEFMRSDNGPEMRARHSARAVWRPKYRYLRARQQNVRSDRAADVACQPANLCRPGAGRRPPDI